MNNGKRFRCLHILNGAMALFIAGELKNLSKRVPDKKFELILQYELLCSVMQPVVRAYMENQEYE